MLQAAKFTGPAAAAAWTALPHDTQDQIITRAINHRAAEVDKGVRGVHADIGLVVVEGGEGGDHRNGKREIRRHRYGDRADRGENAAGQQAALQGLGGIGVLARRQEEGQLAGVIGIGQIGTQQLLTDRLSAGNGHLNPVGAGG